jgi:hypothetical protein
MKVKYLGALFAAAVLSLGLVTSCATPEGGNTDGAETEAPADPAEAPADPAEAPADPAGQ